MATSITTSASLGTPSGFSKSLQVAVGVVRRTVKELAMYRQEVHEGAQGLAAMAVSDDRYSQAKRAYDESVVMVANTQQRLVIAVRDLETKLSGSTEPTDAVDEGLAVLGQAKAALGAS